MGLMHAPRPAPPLCSDGRARSTLLHRHRSTASSAARRTAAGESLSNLSSMPWSVTMVIASVTVHPRRAAVATTAAAGPHTAAQGRAAAARRTRALATAALSALTGSHANHTASAHIPSTSE